MWGRRCTLLTLCAVALIKGADLELLPSSFRAMEIDLGLQPSALGTLALYQGVAFSGAGPLWGNLVDSGLSRKYLIMVGSGCWGLCTLSLGFVTNFTIIAVLRLLNGMALAMLMPVMQSFVADLCEPSERGQVFGLFYMITNLGQLLACLFVTPMSEEQVLGIAGWRLVLFVVGSISFTVTLAAPFMIQEPSREWRPERLGPARELRKLYSFIKIPSFGVIILQGVFGSIPGAAMSFLTMYLQYTGLPNSTCAMVKALGILGEAFGGMLGGIIGDALHRWSPRYGRPLTAQITAVMCVPAAYILFTATPAPHLLVGFYSTMLVLHGLLGCWAVPGCILPVMCDIVPRGSLASAYSWEAAIALCSGSFLGPTLTGVISGTFGYHANQIPVSDMSEDFRQNNMVSLGKALCIFSTIPYFISAVCWSLLFLTYDADVLRQKKTEAPPGDYGAVLPTSE